MLSSKKTKPYCELGKLLDALARSRDVRGPYNIAAYLSEVTEHEVSGQSVSKYLFGTNEPKQAFIVAFADAFKLTEQEKAALAWVYAYGSPILPHRSEALLSS
jgi:hypothetical protein